MVRGSRDKVWELWGLKFKISSLKEWRNVKNRKKTRRKKTRRKVPRMMLGR